MKKILFLACLLSSVCVSSYPMVVADNDKNDYDKAEDRSIPHSQVRLEIVNDGIMFHFMKPLDNVFIQIVDDSGMLVYEESVPLSTSRNYYIPMQEVLSKSYLIRVEGDNIHEEFSILF
ncbi:DUF3244 domain-containing protein [uncultured Parabacteroides sp.]|uniref:DUF3244 domain-containing protein n=1 Tax=uncultured Parabacteroides sp. TaxID=512312 RepID=UPI0026194C7C|nr:DUF3244 domain-containing protein [uncultured Parabacteroides sp.]